MLPFIASCLVPFAEYIKRDTTGEGSRSPALWGAAL